MLRLDIYRQILTNRASNYHFILKTVKRLKVAKAGLKHELNKLKCRETIKCTKYQIINGSNKKYYKIG